jgi:hypothetical protein
MMTQHQICEYPDYQCQLCSRYTASTSKTIAGLVGLLLAANRTNAHGEHAIQRMVKIQVLKNLLGKAETSMCLQAYNN